MNSRQIIPFMWLRLIVVIGFTIFVAGHCDHLGPFGAVDYLAAVERLPESLIRPSRQWVHFLD